MSYRIVFRKRVQKQINGLPGAARAKVKSALLELKENPFPHHCKKIHGYEHHYRIKVGRQYRVVYEVKRKELIITIIRVRHRKDAYKGF